MKITVYIDFVCPYTNRFHSFLELVKEEKELELEWKPFALAEQNRSSDQPIWEQAAIREHAEVMSLAGLEAAKQQGIDVDDYVNEMFLLWHAGDAPTIQDVMDLNQKFGLEKVDECIDAVIVSHGEARKKGIFGSPAVIFEKAEKPMFVKLDHVPEEAGLTFDNMVRLARNTSVIELKKTQ